MNRTTSLFVFLILISFFSYSQHKPDENNHYNWYDDLVGVENTGLYIGFDNSSNYRITEKNHQFFKSYDFLKGSLNYNGQRYYNQELKYSVYGDELLIRLKNKQGETVMQLIRDKLAGFSLNGNQFVKVNDVDDDKSSMSGFYEILEKNTSMTLYKKYSKKKIKKLDRNIIYFEYKYQKNKYYLFYDGVYYNVRSSRDFIKIFPEYKNEIKEFSDRKKRSAIDFKYIGLTKLIYQKTSN